MLGGASSPRVPTLEVTWHPTQEVIFGAGHLNTNDRINFVKIALRRFDRMVRRNTVNPSCVLTLFEFQKNDRSRIHKLLPGRNARSLPGLGRGRFVVMSSTDPARRSIIDLYESLARAGERRPETVMALEFFSHSYWAAPVMVNTNRRSGFCTDRCPASVRHSEIAFTMPVAMPYPRFDRGIVDDAKVTLIRGAASQRATEHTTRDPDDLDPRNTDFVPGMLDSRLIVNMKRALHTHAELRIWGCSNGDMGPVFREVARRGLRGDTGAENELLTIDSSYHPRVVNRTPGGPLRHSIRQQWEVRRGDIPLIYLSRCGAAWRRLSQPRWSVPVSPQRRALGLTRTIREI